MLANTEQLKSLFLQCMALVSEKKYAQAQSVQNKLQQSLAEFFASKTFNKNIFIEESIDAKNCCELLLAIDAFLNEEVNKLTLEINDVSNDLLALNKADKMKKAYSSF